jgi:hypothetical protein
MHPYLKTHFQLLLSCKYNSRTLLYISLLTMAVSNELQEARATLAHTLGFLDYPKSQPYIKYIENQHTGDQKSLHRYLSCFTKHVKYFTEGPEHQIQERIDELYDIAVRQGKRVEREQLADQVMIFLDLG